MVQNDAEHMVVTRLKKRNEDIAKLEGVFRAIDKSGTGLINEERPCSPAGLRIRMMSRNESEGITPVGMDFSGTR